MRRHADDLQYIILLKNTGDSTMTDIENTNMTIDCPNCDSVLDLLNPDDTGCYDNKDSKLDSIKCCVCGHNFNALGLE